MKKILAVILSALFLLSTFSLTVVGTSQTMDGWSYTINSNNEITLTNYSGTASHIEIPSSINGMKVTALGNGLFWDNLYLENITIPQSIEKIGESAFSGSSHLSKINIPDNVTEIVYNTFSGCNALTEIVIPDNVTKIDRYAFSRCANLQSIDFPENLTEIGENAFYSCISLPSIQLPEGLKSIKKNAFSYCSSVRSIKLPETLEVIESSAFSNCSLLTEINLPSTIVSIGSKVFENCVSLEAINLSSFSNATSIAQDAFYNTAFYNNASNWENGVLYLGNILLQANEDISGSYTIKNGTVTIADHAFDSSDITEIIMPDSLQTLGNYVFNHCNRLERITFSQNITTIPKGTFAWCDSFTILDLPDHITSIGPYAFDNCLLLSDIELPSGLVEIGEEAFSFCYSINNITIPNSVSKIGDKAFYECDNLTTIQFPDSPIKIGQYILIGTPFYENGENWINESLYVGNHLIATNNRITGTYQLKDSTIGIAGSCFSSSYELRQIVLPNTLKIIGDYAFQFCSTLETIDIPDSVIYIGTGAFSNCFALRDIQIPQSITNINDETFSSCGSLTEIHIPQNVVSIGNSAFSGCYSITSFIFSDHIKSIGDFALSGCNALKELQIPANVHDIGDNAFGGCISLEKIIVDPQNKVYHSSENCLIETQSGVLKKACNNSIIPNDGSITSIAPYAFADCSNLSSINIPGSVKTIQTRAFSDCSKLAEVTIETGVEIIENGAFQRCSSLSRVNLPESLIFMGNDVFLGSGNFSLIVPKDSYALQYAMYNGYRYYLQGDIAAIFSDVTENQWFTEAVRYCNENHLMNGMGISSDGTGRQRFSPETSMTRAQLVQVLYNMEGAPSVTYTEQFNDVGKNQWFAMPVTWAAQENIVFGKEPGLFDPDAPITRQEITTILFRYAEYKGFDFSVEDPQTTLQSFPDAESVASWATDGLAALVELHVINGNEGYLLPEANARRCEVAMMLSLFVPQLTKTETNP